MRKKFNIKNTQKKFNILQPVEVNVMFPYMMSFDEVYTWFKEQLKDYEPGTILVGKFNGTSLNSNMTEDELWVSYFGNTKEDELKEREQNRKEAEEQYEKSKRELEEFKKQHEQWAIENYGSLELYHQHIIDELCEEAEGLIPNSKMDDWRVTVTKNFDRYEVREVLHYLKRLNEVDRPESVFDELRDYMQSQMHSGTTANWVLSCLEHYGGDKGKKLSQYIR